MARITVEDCLENIDNIFEMVLVAAKRARRIAHGADPMVELENDKPTVLALREIAEGLIDPERVNVLQAEIEAAEVFDLPPEEEKAIPTVCSSLDQALDALDADREFLTAGGVFTDDMIDGYIQLKMDEVTRMRMTTHPVEFDMYYSL